MGFDYFYGFNASYSDQFHPSLYENRNKIEVNYKNGYMLENDLADHAISWIRQQQNLSDNTPFLLYYAPGSAHSPIQAPKEWRDKFKGKFDQGWDNLREEIYKQQKSEGIIPKGTKLTKRPSQIPSWSSLSDDERKINARIMESYAAMVTYSDNQFGRIIKELEKNGQLDNTLIFFIEGDNGSAGESYKGDFNEMAMFIQRDTLKQDIKNVDLIGGPHSQPVLSAGWAWAMSTPFQWSKQVASHFGGTRNGLVVSWPEK